MLLFAHLNCDIKIVRLNYLCFLSGVMAIGSFMSCWFGEMCYQFSLVCMEDILSVRLTFKLFTRLRKPLLWPAFVRAGLDDPNTIVQSLDCTNDMIDTISCDMKAPNCSLYRLRFLEEKKSVLFQSNSLKLEGGGCIYFAVDSFELTCFVFNRDMYCRQGTAGRCHCPMDHQNTIKPIYGENHTVTVWKGNENLGSTHMSISASSE